MMDITENIKSFVNEHSALTISLCLPILIIFIYQLSHPSLVPGRPNVICFSFSGSRSPQPRSSTLSIFNHVIARIHWSLFALKRGKTPAQLSKEVLMDFEINWKSGECPKNGDLVYTWDKIFEWDNDCINLITLEYLRNFGDPLSENVLEQFSKEQQQQQQGQTNIQDTMEKVVDHVLRNPKKEDDINTFWKAITQKPPLGCGALPLQWYLDNGLLTSEEVNKIGYGKVDIESLRQDLGWKPDQHTRTTNDRWTTEQKEFIKQEEEKAIQRARETFHRYGPNMSVGLLLVGLAGGFASPRIMEVLRSTGYLVPARKKKEKLKDEEEDALAERLHQYTEKGRNAVRNEKEKDAKTANLTLPSPTTADRTYRRLLETITFLLDLNETFNSLQLPPDQLNESLTPEEVLNLGGKGWLACCRVRFLHTNVRRRLLLNEKKMANNADVAEDVYSSTKSGLAINQEDLLATLCAFSVAPLWSLQRLGIPPTRQERQDLIGFWRFVGFYMGIEPCLLQRCFRDIQSAERTFLCISSHHFLPFAGVQDSFAIPPPSIPSSFGPSLFMKKGDMVKQQDQKLIQTLANRFDFDRGPALPLLWSIANRPPGNMSFANLCSIARFLLGPGLANATSLPRTTRKQFWLMRLRLFILAYPVLFGRYYPRRSWAIELRLMWMQLIRRVVIYYSGSKRTSFRTSKDGSHDDTYMAYTLNAEDGKRIVKEYWRIMREMIIVTSLTALIAISIFAWTVYSFNRFLSF